MRHSIISLLFLLMFNHPVEGGQWSVGTSIGYSWFSAIDVSFEGSALSTSYVGPALEFQPGLRLGFASDGGVHGFGARTGYGRSSVEDLFTTSSFVLNIGYEFTPWPERSIKPYLTASGGFGSFGFEDRTPTGTSTLSGEGLLFGGGIGVRHHLGSGNGALRAELRYDRVGSVRDRDITLVPKGHAMGVLMGFDLFL